MSVKSCNIRIPSGLSDAQVAADAACAAKRYAYSAEQVESRLNSYVEDLTGLDLEQIAANTAAAADIVNTVTTARDEAVAAANTVEELAPQVKDMLDTIVEQDLEQLRQDIAVATDLIATVDGKVTAAQNAATDAAGSALRADQSETAAEEALAETWTAYSAVLTEKETAAADFKADADGKVAAAVDAQLNPGGDFYAAVRTAVFDTIPAKVDSYVTEVTSEGGTLYEYVAESQDAISARRDGVIEDIIINRTAALDAIDTLQEKAIADIVYSGAAYIDYIAYSGQLAIDAITTAEQTAIDNIDTEVAAATKDKVDELVPEFIDQELADENGAWNVAKNAAIDAAEAQATLAQDQADLARLWATSENLVAGTSYKGAYGYMLDAQRSATAAQESATAAATSMDSAERYSYGAFHQATAAYLYSQSAKASADAAYLYSQSAKEYAESAEEYSHEARACVTRAEDAAALAQQWATSENLVNGTSYSGAYGYMLMSQQAATDAATAKTEAALQAQQATGAASDAAGSYDSVVTAYEGVLDAYSHTLDAYEGAKAAMADAQGFATDANAAKESISLIVDSANWQNQNISVDTATGAFTTTPGSVYAVWCKEGCAIYKDAAFADKFCTIWAEEQRCFMATQTSYYVYPIELAASISINTAYYLRTEN